MTDGEHLYVFLGLSGVVCLDLDGKIVWQQQVGDNTHHWGSGTSPALCDDLLVVNASVESEKLIALRKDSGKIVWEVDGISRNWSSPIVVDAHGKKEIVLNSPRRIVAYEPATGDELWFCDGIPDGYICPSVIANDGIVYAIGGRKNTAIAVKAGGSGDVTQSHILWKIDKGSNVSSPVLVDQQLFWVHEKRGVAYVIDAQTGELVEETRLRPRPGLIYASATLADNKIFVTSQDNGTYVFSASPLGELLAVNTFKSDSSRCNASFAVSRNRLLLRTDQALYCLGQSP